MHVTARGDYAVRAAVELAAAEGETRKVADIAAAQEIPARFLENILLALRRAGLVQSRRGADGGFRLARPPEPITLADVLRAVEGPLANVQGVAPDQVEVRRLRQRAAGCLGGRAGQPPSGPGAGHSGRGGQRVAAGRVR